MPRIWNWYSYMDPGATELVLAVRAINIFLSLSLVLFGLMNILLAFMPNITRKAAAVVLSTTALLWLTRVVVLCCHAIPLFAILAAEGR